MGKKVGLVLLVLFLLFYLNKKASKLFSSLGRLIPSPLHSPNSTGLGDVIQPVAEDSDPAEPLPKRDVKLVDRMRETAKKDPDEIAKVIKTMMSE
jgi:flagellar biosynthesis/type III secretory pathway M-ring protein FliF/YscJ